MFVQGCYEGFGFNGLMIIVEILILNVNCMIVNVCIIFNKKGGNIGVVGFVSYMFDNMGVIVFKGLDFDYIFEILFEVEVDVCDVIEEEGNIVIYIEFIDFYKGIVVLKVVGIIEFLIIELEMIV